MKHGILLMTLAAAITALIINAEAQDLSFDGLLLFLVFLLMAKHKVRQGFYLVVFLIWYGVVRFGLDFLRAYEGAVVDERYFGLTPAQYGSVVMVAAGIWLFVRLRQKKS